MAEREVTRHGPSAMADLDRPAVVGGNNVRVSSASLPRSAHRPARRAGPGGRHGVRRHPQGNGTYYACYVKTTGVVKLINYPKVSTCPPRARSSSSGTPRDRRVRGGPQGRRDRRGAGTQGRPGTSRGLRLEQLGRHRQQARGPRRRPGRLGWRSPTSPAGFADGVDNGVFVRGGDLFGPFGTSAGSPGVTLSAGGSGPNFLDVPSQGYPCVSDGGAGPFFLHCSGLRLVRNGATPTRFSGR